MLLNMRKLKLQMHAWYDDSEEINLTSAAYSVAERADFAFLSIIIKQF